MGIINLIGEQPESECKQHEEMPCKSSRVSTEKKGADAKKNFAWRIPFA